MLIKELGLNVKKLLINESFDWNTEWDNDTARQLNSIIMVYLKVQSKQIFYLSQKEILGI